MHLDKMETIGQRLRRGRLEAGLTHEAAAALAEVSLSTIVRSEGQTTRPRKATVRVLAGAYGKPVEWFYGDDPVESPGGNPEDQVEEDLVAAPTLEGQRLTEVEGMLVRMYRNMTPAFRRIIIGVARVTLEQSQGTPTSSRSVDGPEEQTRGVHGPA